MTHQGALNLDIAVRIEAALERERLRIGLPLAAGFAFGGAGVMIWRNPAKSVSILWKITKVTTRIGGKVAFKSAKVGLKVAPKVARVGIKVAPKAFKVTRVIVRFGGKRIKAPAKIAGRTLGSAVVPVAGVIGTGKAVTTIIKTPGPLSARIEAGNIEGQFAALDFIAWGLLPDRLTKKFILKPIQRVNPILFALRKVGF